MSALLLRERPLVVLPGLAKAIGLNEAIAAQQVYWLQSNSRDARDGWVEKNREEWVAEFPFWSSATIRRTFDSLVSQGLLSVRKARPGFDQTRAFRLDEKAVLRLSKSANRLAQSEPLSAAQSEPISLAQSEPLITKTELRTSELRAADAKTHREADEVAEFLDRVTHRLSPTSAERIRDAFLGFRGKGIPTFRDDLPPMLARLISDRERERTGNAVDFLAVPTTGVGP